MMMDTAYLDMEFFKTISNFIPTKWGGYYYNLDAPNYYDANHAHVDSNEINHDNIDEIFSFYASKKITPRIYFYGDNNQDYYREVCHSSNFSYRRSTDRLLFINTAENRELIQMSDGITIHHVKGDLCKEAIKLLSDIQEFGGEGIRESILIKQMSNSNFYYYILKINGEPCSVASIFNMGKVARLEDVATLEKFRGKGLIGELIDYIIFHLRRKGIDEVNVIPNNESSEGVYLKYGFQVKNEFITGYGLPISKFV